MATKSDRVAAEILKGKKGGYGNPKGPKKKPRGKNKN